jgi:putative tricarboxylic transport membrane protein
MFFDVYPILIGTVLGVLSGLIPGIGNFILLLIATPILLTMNPLDIIITYVALVSVSQYIGSVPATIFGIAGESSSFPAVIEAKKLKSADEVSEAISGAAIGSFYGSFIVVVLCFIFAPYIGNIKYLFSTKLYISLLSIAIILICTLSSQSIIKNILLVLFGLFLGSIGYNTHFNTPFLTFDNIYLYSGLPFIVVSVMLFAVPLLLQHAKLKDSSEFFRFPSTFKIYKLNIISSTFYSAVGFIGGLVPGLTTVLSSYAAYYISRLFTTSPIKRIVASETANNSGAFSQLLPLLLFSIPIVSSEAYLLNILDMKGFSVYNYGVNTLLVNICVNLVLINLLGLLLAWPLAKYIVYLYSIKISTIMYSLLFMLMLLVMYLGYSTNSLLFYIYCCIGLLPLTYLLRKVDTSPLIFAFLIQDSFLDNLIRLPNLL